LAFAALTSVVTAARIARADFSFDPAYNTNYFIDAFSTGEGGGAFRYGYRLTTLANGDVVVAGQMRFPNDSLDAESSDVDLLRYGPLGVRKTWTGPAGPYSWFNSNQRRSALPESLQVQIEGWADRAWSFDSDPSRPQKNEHDNHAPFAHGDISNGPVADAISFLPSTTTDAEGSTPC